jgi:tRNA threonylcarbamoyladenosine biosynthesis protein TsaE
MVEFKTSSPKETEKLGESFARNLKSGLGSFISIFKVDKVETVSNRALTIALNGELGTGKTTFIKGLAKGLGVKETITSPTYVFVRSYSFDPIIRDNFHKDTLYHLDLYRLENQDTKTLQAFGFDEIISDPKGVVVIEWEERLGNTANFLLSLSFNYNNERERLIATQINK